MRSKLQHFPSISAATRPGIQPDLEGTAQRVQQQQSIRLGRHEQSLRDMVQMLHDAGAGSGAGHEIRRGSLTRTYSPQGFAEAGMGQFVPKSSLAVSAVGGQTLRGKGSGVLWHEDTQ